MSGREERFADPGKAACGPHNQLEIDDMQFNPVSTNQKLRFRMQACDFHLYLIDLRF
jgi:hypothetical protein